MKNNVQKENEIVTSTGKIGEAEGRTFGRVYLSDPQLYDSEKRFLSRWSDLEKEAELIAKDKSERRRVVFRTFVTANTLGSLLKRFKGNKNINFDMVLPISEIDSKKDEKVYLIMLAKNEHENRIHTHESSRLEVIARQSTPKRDQGSSLYEKVLSLPKGYSLTYKFSEKDVLELLSLWKHNFEWTSSGISSFNKELGSGSMWFCGVRDARGKLVAACMAEAVWFRDRWFTELTEWASSVRGVSSKMVIALISQVLEVLYYNQKEKLPFMVAEMNLFHEDQKNLGSPGAGISAGLRVPRLDYSDKSLSHNVLKHNVLVGNGRKDESFANINNFVLGVLSEDMVKSSYGEKTVRNINHKIKENE